MDSEGKCPGDKFPSLPCTPPPEKEEGGETAVETDLMTLGAEGEGTILTTHHNKSIPNIQQLSSVSLGGEEEGGEEEESNKGFPESSGTEASSDANSARKKKKRNRHRRNKKKAAASTDGDLPTKYLEEEDETDTAILNIPENEVKLSDTPRLPSIPDHRIVHLDPPKPGETIVSLHSLLLAAKEKAKTVNDVDIFLRPSSENFLSRDHPYMKNTRTYTEQELEMEAEMEERMFLHRLKSLSREQSAENLPNVQLQDTLDETLCSESDENVQEVKEASEDLIEEQNEDIVLEQIEEEKNEDLDRVVEQIEIEKNEDSIFDQNKNQVPEQKEDLEQFEVEKNDDSIVEQIEEAQEVLDSTFSAEPEITTNSLDWTSESKEIGHNKKDQKLNQFLSTLNENEDEKVHETLEEKSSELTEETEINQDQELSESINDVNTHQDNIWKQVISSSPYEVEPMEIDEEEEKDKIFEQFKAETNEELIVEPVEVENPSSVITTNSYEFDQNKNQDDEGVVERFEVEKNEDSIVELIEQAQEVWEESEISEESKNNLNDTFIVDKTTSTEEVVNFDDEVLDEIPVETSELIIENATEQKPTPIETILEESEEKEVVGTVSHEALLRLDREWDGTTESRSSYGNVRPTESISLIRIGTPNSQSSRSSFITVELVEPPSPIVFEKKIVEETGDKDEEAELSSLSSKSSVESEIVKQAQRGLGLRIREDDESKANKIESVPIATRNNEETKSRGRGPLRAAHDVQLVKKSSSEELLDSDSDHGQGCCANLNFIRSSRSRSSKKQKAAKDSDETRGRKKSRSQSIKDTLTSVARRTFSKH